MYLCTLLPNWAESAKIKGRTYYFLSRSKVIKELPYFYDKEDTVRRAFNTLKRKKLIHYEKKKELDYVCPTRRCAGWDDLGKTFAGENNFGDSEKKFGNANDGSRPVEMEDLGKRKKKLPTDQYNINKKSDQYAHAYANALDFLKEYNPIQFENWQSQYKSQIKNFKKFAADFNDVFHMEKHPYQCEAIYHHLRLFSRNWIANQDRYEPRIEEPIPPYLRNKIK